MRKKHSAFAICLTIAVILLIVSATNFLPAPGKRTTVQLRALEFVIRTFAAENGHLPESLLDLAEGERERIPQDGWGRDIQYSKEGSRVVLTSFGRDGNPGGVGKDEDLIRVFTVQKIR